MADKNPNKLYDRIKTIKGSLESIISTVDSVQEEVKQLLADSDDFGGVISKVFKEQLAKYFTPELAKIVDPVKNLMDGDRVPGSLKDLVVFLDSVPLAMVREEPSVAELAAPVVPENANIEAPVGDSKVTSEIDDLPDNASFDNLPSADEEEDKVLPESKKSLSRRMRESRHPFLKLREGVFDDFHFINFSKEEDQERWRNSEKGKQEGDWWLNRCHAEDTNRFINSNAQGTLGTWVSHDAKESMEKFGKIFVDDESDRPVEPSYAASLIKTWGEPKSKIESLEEAKEKDSNIEIYQVIRTSTEGSPLGEDVANLEDSVVYEFDKKEDAEEKVEELNNTVTPEEKALLGTEYKVEKRKISTEKLA